MNRIAGAAALVILVIGGAQAAPARKTRPQAQPPKTAVLPGDVRLDGLDHTYVSLLIGPDASVKRAARLLAEQAVPTRDVLDVTATLLWQGCTGRPDVDDSAQVWLVTALGAAADTRYWNVLLDCAHDAQHRRVREKANQVLDQLADEDVPQLRGSAIRLHRVQASLAEAVARDAAHRPHVTLKDIARGDGLEAVYAKLGLPDRVQIVSVQFSGILATWDTLGSITFRTARGERGAWQVASMVAAGDKGDARSAQVRQWLATEDPRALMRVGKELAKAGETNRAVLDEVARRIDRDFDTEDDDLVGGLSWLCKALGASGDGRYRVFLGEIADLAASRKLRAHAQSAEDRLPTGDPDPY